MNKWVFSQAAAVPTKYYLNTTQSGLHQKLKTGAAFLDISATYDGIWRNSLLLKASKIIPCNAVMEFFQEILPVIGFAFSLVSGPHIPQNGLAQDSVIALILFCIYTSDFPQTSSWIFVYADDSVLTTQA